MREKYELANERYELANEREGEIRVSQWETR